MSAANVVTQGPGETFSGSPYLHDMVSRQSSVAAPASLPLSDLKAFILRCLENAGNGPAGSAALAALSNYATLADQYGTLFPEETINSSLNANALVQLPELEAGFVAALPNRPAVLSVLDEGVPFVHERTRDTENQTRLLSVWLQDARPDVAQSAHLPFGKSLDRAAIQALIDSGADEESLYRESAATDRTLRTPQRYCEPSTHGASVLGLAAGHRIPEDDKKPDTHLLMGVSFPPIAVRDTSGSLLPLFVLLGICQCIERTRLFAAQLAKADPKRFKAVQIPLVFNLSYGVLAGPKDGSGILETVMNSLSELSEGAITGLGKIEFFLPMGNGRLSQTAATLGGTRDRSVALRLIPDDLTPSYVEVWECKTSEKKPAHAHPVITLTAPQTSTAIPIPAVEFGHYLDVAIPGSGTVRVYSVLRKSDAGYREMQLLAFPPTAALGTGPITRAGDWQIDLLDDQTSAVQVYVQRDDGLFGLASGGRQSRMHHPDYEIRDPQGRLIRRDPDGSNCPITRTGSVNAFANAPAVTRVGGTIGEGDALAVYSALGLDDPDRPQEGDSLSKSDDSRSTAGILVPGTTSGSVFRVSGTSLATPQAALDEVRKLTC